MEGYHDLIPISALQHYSYCPRQCALIHVEQTFHENLFTLRGRAVHRRVHDTEPSSRAGIRCERGLPLWSTKLSLTGKADLVEFDDDGAPHPVEYKRGHKRRWGHDELQLCAQALCLEEMFEHRVPSGAIFYHASRARVEVAIDESLREEVRRTMERVRELLASEFLPPPVNDPRCKHCSLRPACMPDALTGGRLKRLDLALFDPSQVGEA